MKVKKSKYLNWIINRTRVLCLFFAVVSFSSLFAQTNRTESKSYKNIQLETVLNEWKDVQNLSISYDFDLIKGIVITQSFDHLNLLDQFTKLLRGTGLVFDILDDQSIIIHANLSSNLVRRTSSICGRLYDLESGFPIQYAHVKLLNTDKGAVSNDEGKFNIEGVFVPDDELKITMIGYDTLIVRVNELLGGECPKRAMKFSENQLMEVLIEDRLTEASQLTESVENRDVVKLDKVGLVGGQVDQDIMHYIQLLPGISSADESASEIHIRGGTAGQNLILLDGITMYHIGHFFGKVSSINPSIVEEIAVEKEGINAQYGGRVSGLIDIKTKSKVPEKVSGEIGVNLMSLSAHVTIPLISEKLGFYVSYRRSVSDFYQSLAFQKYFDQTFQGSRISDDQEEMDSSFNENVALVPKTYFRDINAKLNWKPNKNNFASLSFFQMTDDMTYWFRGGENYQERDSLSIKSTGLNVSWKHEWNKSHYSDLSFSYTGYRNIYEYISSSSRDSANFVYDNYNEIRDLKITLANKKSWLRNELTYGYQWNEIEERAQADYLVKNPRSNSRFFADMAKGRFQSLFLDYSYKKLNRLTLNFGNRFSYYDLTKKYYYEPRFWLGYYPGEKWQFNLAGGIYYQGINQIVESNALNVEDHLWILARNGENGDELYAVVKNIQYSFGLEYKAKQWELGASIFQKDMEGISSRILKFDNRQVGFHTGKMNSRGVEFSAKYTYARFQVLSSYTYNDVFFDFDYPEYKLAASYNQQHSLNQVLMFKYKKISASLKYTFGSGKPYTPVDSIVIDRTDPDKFYFWIQYKDFNQLRLPSYHRFDLSLSWVFNLKSTEGELSISAINIFNNTNTLQRNYSLDRDFNEPTALPRLVQSDRLGLPFTPNVGLVLKFGN